MVDILKTKYDIEYNSVEKSTILINNASSIDSINNIISSSCKLSYKTTNNNIINMEKYSIDYSSNTNNIYIKNPEVICNTFPNYSYLYHKVDPSSPTLIWIPGGGLSSLLFAFSGTGPYYIDNSNNLKINIHTPNYNQLFLDVLGTGLYANDNYPNNDTNLVHKFSEYILNILNDLINNKNLNNTSIILIGVSYGGKTAIQIANILHYSKFKIKRTIGITPFYNPVNSMSYIPYPGSRLQLKLKLKDYDISYTTINKYREDFKINMNNNNWEKALTYMDDTGKYSQYTKNLLKLNKTNSLNVWNINKFDVDTLGKWNIPNLMAKIKQFLYNSSTPNKYTYLKGLYNKNKQLNNNNYLLNGKFWKSLAYTHTISEAPSYLTSVDVSNLQYPLTIIAGEYDVITSFDGLYELYKSISKKNIQETLYSNYRHYNNEQDDLYLIHKGTHLLCMNHGAIIKRILDAYNIT